MIYHLFRERIAKAYAPVVLCAPVSVSQTTKCSGVATLTDDDYTNSGGSEPANHPARAA